MLARARRPSRKYEAPQGLPPWRRLRATREFARVERQGARVGGDCIAVTVRRGPGRVGFVVSKKVDNRAAQRNLVKRRLRDIMRRRKDQFVRVGVDVVVTARAEAKALSYQALAALVEKTLAQAVAKLNAGPARSHGQRARRSPTS